MKKIHILILMPLLNFGQNVQLKDPKELFPVIHLNSQSPVKNQGNKNTCSAFGIAAAFETFPNAPKDLSEKYLYAVQKSNDYINNQPTVKGNYLFKYIALLKNMEPSKKKIYPTTLTLPLNGFLLIMN